MSAMTDYLENKIIDWLFRGVAYTPATTLYFGLLTAAPTDSTAGTEVSASGTNYARQPLACSAANWAATNGATLTTNPSTGTGGTTSNNSAVTFGVPSANWGTIAAWGIYDAVSGGHLLFYTLQTPNKTVNNGDPAPSFAISAAQVQIDN